MTKHIAVLKGGRSAEREVSLVSGAACADAARALGYRVTELDAQGDIAARLAELKPDAVFNALHGRFGEDGCVQGVLEWLMIPYTHSGVLASAIAMDKPTAKRLFVAAGLRVPKGVSVSRETLRDDPLPRPFVIKPANEGSSVGVHIVTREDNRPLEVILGGEGIGLRGETLRAAHPSPLLAEEYIPGRELTVAVLDDAPLAVTELRTRDGFYDYTNKYTAGKTEHLCPAPLPKNIYDAALNIALTAHRALGCRGLSRADFRYDEARGDAGLYILELNTQPGMTPLSLAPEQAAFAGISFTSLVQRLIETATLGR